ncbi:endonuclease/exonuclease/phosphatase family protein [Flavobacterium sp.]|uniref:endonuclease/exonuclease/phosphatase family protein n=1 Tax=Flavobacterium sp. TaxID=239 RepID=UPI00286E8F3A|nr:endonuclease/exonuclease/phosphatase family protein [Flavobacterium sp.]
MKKYFSLLLYATSFYAQINICSWNVENLGKSKSEETIVFMANTLRNFDVVAIQEVVAGYGGTQAVAKLADELNRKGAKWDYTVSDPTSSSAYKTERYAFLWKTSKLKIKGKAWLEKKYHIEIDREPYYATFEHNKKTFTLVNFHAITKNRNPETEIKYFKFIPLEYPNLNLIFVGDFNCPQSHTVFNPLRKMAYKSVFENQKTSLKKECHKEQCLASEFDNIWHNTSKVEIEKNGVIHFYKQFKTLKQAREISDHIPISAEILLK